MGSTKLVSLGRACEVAHQIRRLKGPGETLFFDWIVSEHDALIRFILGKSGSLLDPNKTELAPNRKSVLDTGSGFRFYPHDFLSENGLIGVRYYDEIDRVRERYLRRATRLSDLLATGRFSTIFIRHMLDTPSQLLSTHRHQIEEAIEATYGDLPIKLVCLTFQPVELSESIIPIRRGLDWRGDDREWDRVLRLLENGHDD